MSFVNKKALSFLVVEDNKDHAFIILNTIKEFYSENIVSHKKDGEEAIGYLKSLPSEKLPDIVLLDIKMPRKDGFDVLKFIRKNPKLKHLPIVMLSTSSQNNEILQAYKIGANTYLSKPVNFKDFVRVINQVNQYWSETAIIPRLDAVYD